MRSIHIPRSELLQAKGQVALPPIPTVELAKEQTERLNSQLSQILITKQRKENDK